MINATRAPQPRHRRRAARAVYAETTARINRDGIQGAINAIRAEHTDEDGIRTDTPRKARNFDHARIHEQGGHSAITIAHNEIEIRIEGPRPARARFAR